MRYEGIAPCLQSNQARACAPTIAIGAHARARSALLKPALRPADISTVGWVFSAPFVDISLDEFPNLKKWLERIEARPAVQEGMDVPEGSLARMKEFMSKK